MPLPIKIEEQPELQRIADAMLDSIESMSRGMPPGSEMRIVISDGGCGVEWYIAGIRIMHKERLVSRVPA